MRAALRLLFIAALAAAAVVSADDGAVEGSAKAEENSRAEEAKQLLANAKLPEWMNTEGQQKSLCCSLATPGYEKALLNCVRRNGPMPVGVTAEEESDGYTQEEGKKARQKKSLDGSGRILVLMEVRRAENSAQALQDAPLPMRRSAQRRRSRRARSGSHRSRRLQKFLLISDLPGPAGRSARAWLALRSAGPISLRPAPPARPRAGPGGLFPP